MNLVTPDSGLLFWMVLIFAVVFFILWRFGFPIITDMVEKRSARIEDSLKLAREAEKRMQDLAREQEALVAQSRQEQTRILQEATRARAAIIERAGQEASEKAAQLLEKARTEIAAEKESALRDIRREVALLSVDVAEKVVREKLQTDENQMAYIGRLVEEMTQEK